LSSRRVIPAGFHQTVLASSATAAPPAQALPRPLVPFSVIWIPDARTALEEKITSFFELAN
jgi:hypothetical protein